jgi:hypothetical protein
VGGGGTGDLTPLLAIGDHRLAIVGWLRPRRRPGLAATPERSTGIDHEPACGMLGPAPMTTLRPEPDSSTFSLSLLWTTSENEDHGWEAWLGPATTTPKRMGCRGATPADL